MSRVTKRKHVMNEALWDDLELPRKDHSVVKVLRSMGNNLHQVTAPSGEVYLVSMPIKFRRNIWVKRGDYILVEPIPEGKKVQAEIVKIFNKESIKFYKENKIWPQEFDDSKKVEEKDDGDLFENTNRNRVQYDSESSEDSDSSDNSDNNDSEESGDDNNDNLRH